MDKLRAKFEEFFGSSRSGRGQRRRPTFERLEEGTYTDDSTQRHWWTWQQSFDAARAALAEPVADEPVASDALHKFRGVQAFLESLLRTKSRDVDDWYGDVAIAVRTLQGALDDATRPATAPAVTPFRVLDNIKSEDDLEAYVQARIAEEAAPAERDALRADAEQLRLSLTFIVDRDLTYFDGYVDRHQISMGAIEQARRVLKSGAAIDAARHQSA